MVTHVALISKSPSVDFATTARIAAALQRQLSEDFSVAWDIPATINAFHQEDNPPEHYWLIVIRDDIGEDARGLHRVEAQEPIALVAAHADVNRVALTCSHELLEMLADPSGKKVSEPSDPPADTNLPPELQGARVQYLLEVCDPCQAGRYSYDFDGISVSNFCLPTYYTGTNGPAFKRTNGFPREVRPGGYVSFCTEVAGVTTWWQTDLFGARLRTTKQELGPGTSQTLRQTIDCVSSRSLREVLTSQPSNAADADEATFKEHLLQYDKRCHGARARASALNELLAKLKAAKP